MWTKSSLGMASNPFGSRSFLAFLLAFSLFLPSALSAQNQTTQPTRSPSPSLIQMLPAPPQLPTAQSKNSLPISEQRRLALLSWIDWWEQQELPWRNQLVAWKSQLQASWTSLKTLLDKQNQDTDAALKAKDAEIAARDQKISLLESERDAYKAELQKKNGWDFVEKGLDVLGGLGAGFILGHFTK